LKTIWKRKNWKKNEKERIEKDLVRFGQIWKKSKIRPKLDKKDYKKKLELKLELIWSALV
jgi:hypothetical protein